MTVELTIDEAAEVMRVSVSEFRRILKRHPGRVRKIKHGYRRVRYVLDEVAALEKKLREEAVEKAVAA
jgi:predicted transcriptional regulator of viral defense system